MKCVVYDGTTRTKQGVLYDRQENKRTGGQKTGKKIEYLYRRTGTKEDRRTAGHQDSSKRGQKDTKTGGQEDSRETGQQHRRTEVQKTGGEEGRRT